MKVNRFYILFALLAILLGYCVFISTNVYVNAFLLFFGFLFLVCGFAYIDENKNEKEEKFSEKLENIF